MIEYMIQWKYALISVNSKTKAWPIHSGKTLAMVIANGVPGFQDLDACECYSLKVQFVWKASEVFNPVCLIYFFFRPLSAGTGFQDSNNDYGEILGRWWNKMRWLWDSSLDHNKLQKLVDALRETGETGDKGDTWDTGEKGETGLIGSTVLRYDLTEIKPRMGEISNS